MAAESETLASHFRITVDEVDKWLTRASADIHLGPLRYENELVKRYGSSLTAEVKQ